MWCIKTSVYKQTNKQTNESLWSSFYLRPFIFFVHHINKMKMFILSLCLKNQTKPWAMITWNLKVFKRHAGNKKTNSKSPAPQQFHVYYDLVCSWVLFFYSFFSSFPVKFIQSGSLYRYFDIFVKNLCTGCLILFPEKKKITKYKIKFKGIFKNFTKRNMSVKINTFS